MFQICFSHLSSLVTYGLLILGYQTQLLLLTMYGPTNGMDIDLLLGFIYFLNAI